MDFSGLLGNLKTQFTPAPEGQNSTFYDRFTDPKFRGLLAMLNGMGNNRPIGESVQAGTQLTSSLIAQDEEKKRRDMIDKMITEGGFTTQEQALIRASDNPASVAVQIRNQKAIANKPNAFQQRQTIGTEQGLVGKELSDFVLTGNLPKPTEVKPRRIETDANGVRRFVDTGERVFSNVKVDDPVTDTADFQNYMELREENPKLTFTQFMKNKKPIQSKGVYKNRETGEIFGELNFDPNDGTYFQYDPQTEQRIILDIKKFSPVTDATFAKTIPNFTQFGNNLEELNTDNASMRRLSEYMTTVNSTNEGLLRLADQFNVTAKTLLGGFFKRAFDIDDYTSLSKSEISTKLSQGRLQGLIGRFRLETVGGGVMTEQDALRIISALGGDVNLLQNKEIVAQQLASIFKDKSISLNRKIKLHNNAVKQIYSESGYEKIDPVEFDESIFTPDRSLLEKEKSTSPNARKFSNEELQDMINKALSGQLSLDSSQFSDADREKYIELLNQ